MRILQIVLGKLIVLGVLCVGILFFFADLEAAYQGLVNYLPFAESPVVQRVIRYVVAAVVVVAAILALLPPLRVGRKKRAIAFQGGHGNVTIQLDTVEASLNRAALKLPEVRKAYVRIHPAEDARKVNITVEVDIDKHPDASVVESSERIDDYLTSCARQYLGPDVVLGVDVKVRRINPGSEDVPVPGPPRSAKDEAREAIPGYLPGAAIEAAETPEQPVAEVGGQPVEADKGPAEELAEAAQPERDTRFAPARGGIEDEEERSPAGYSYIDGDGDEEAPAEPTADETEPKHAEEAETEAGEEAEEKRQPGATAPDMLILPEETESTEGASGPGGPAERDEQEGPDDHTEGPEERRTI